MSTLLDPLVKLVQKYRGVKARPTIAKLRGHQHPKLKAIGDALHETLSKNLSAEEKAFVANIEQRRNDLLHSTEEIPVIDYGAGSNTSTRSQEEMDAGVQSTAIVSNICKASKPAEWAVLLFSLIRKLKPVSAVELGSCVGISASYQAGALKMNGKGTLQTLEGSPEIAKIAKNTLSGLNLHNAMVVAGPFNKTLQGVLESAQPVDYLFNDGHHDYDAVKTYFQQSLPYLADEAIMVLDDISWSPGMRKAWTEIEQHENVIASIDLQKIGIIIIGKQRIPDAKFRIPL